MPTLILSSDYRWAGSPMRVSVSRLTIGSSDRGVASSLGQEGDR